MIKALLKKISHFLGYSRPAEPRSKGLAGRYPNLLTCFECGARATYFVPDLIASAGKPYYIWRNYCDYHGPLSFLVEDKR